MNFSQVESRLFILKLILVFLDREDLARLHMPALEHVAKAAGANHIEHFVLAPENGDALPLREICNGIVVVYVPIFVLPDNPIIRIRHTPRRRIMRLPDLPAMIILLIVIAILLIRLLIYPTRVVLI